MAIQQIESSRIEGEVKIERKINSGAMKLVMDTIQMHQYTKPIESVVRELTSNAVDSQTEKEKAIEILTGKAKYSDFFIERKGDLYDDSKWTPEYYDLSKFNMEKNKVELIYKEGEGAGWVDQFIVTDYGVGIGESRLSGYFQIGFSTKRNRKDVLGAYGFGAKVSLATGCDYYIMETVHNGKKFSFTQYSYKIDPRIGPINMKDGSENPHVVWEVNDASIKVYYELTEETNYTKIITPAKKIQKSKYVQAVKSQLLYFNNVEFSVENSSGEAYNVDFRANIVHNSPNIILSDNNQFSKPHIVIVKGEESDGVGVCYGYIDFGEMELDQIGGNIGIKCPIRSVITGEHGEEIILQEGVSVIPSRESVIWNDATRDFIKSRFNTVVEEASRVIEKELKETDFLKWVDKCRSILTKSSSNSVLGRLSSIVEADSIRPSFIGNKDVKYSYPTDLFWGISIQKVSKRYIPDKNQKNTLQAVREVFTSWFDFNAQHLFLKEGSYSKEKDFFILETEGLSFFNTFSLKDPALLLEVYPKSGSPEATKKSFDKDLAIRDYIWQMLLQSEAKDYDKLIISEEWSEKFKQKEVYDEEKSRQEELTPKERRDLEEKIIFHVPVYDSYRFYKDGKVINWTKKEIKYDSLLTTSSEIYYGFQKDDELITIAALLLEVQARNGLLNLNEGSLVHRICGDQFKLVKIAKENKKYFSKHKHVSELFASIKDNKISMSTALVRWNTARKISENIVSLEFLTNFSGFKAEHAETYTFLEEYMHANYSDSRNRAASGLAGEKFQQFMTFADQIVDFQIFIEDHLEDAEAISEKAKSLVLPVGTNAAFGIDLEVYNKYLELLEYAEPIKGLLNYLEILTRKDSKIPFETEVLIREFLITKERL